MVSSGYEELEHTADVALRVWARNFEDLLRQSAEGMYDLMGVELDRTVEKNGTFHLEDGNREIQLVDFLNEILYLAEQETSIFKNFAFSEHEIGVSVKASGFKAISIHRNIKAVTFHDLDINETDRGLETQITFDV